jgi:hypothetical protein
LVIEVVGLPFVERPPLHDQAGCGRRVCLHALRSCTAVDVGIKDGGNKAGSALEAIVGENGSRLSAGHAGFPVVVGSIAWAGLGIRQSSGAGHSLDDFGRRRGDGCPLLYLRIGVEGNILAVVGLRVVGLLGGTGLTDSCFG